MRIIGEIERLDNPTPDAFLRRCVEADRPAIVTGALSHWAALTRWTPAHFRATSGAVPVAFRRSRTYKHPDFEDPTDTPVGTSTLSDYLDAILEAPEVSDRARYYLGGDGTRIIEADKIRPDLAHFLEECGWPAYVPRDRVEVVGLWLSGLGVRSRLHFDGNGAHNLNAQVTGSKHVIMFAPDQRPRLHLFQRAQMRFTNFSQVDVEEPDHERYPLFRDAECLEGTLNAGEMVFIPALWFHSFKHLGHFNTNLNFWWTPEEPALAADRAPDAATSGTTP